MTALQVAEKERGVIRVFALDLPESDLKRLTDPAKHDPTPQATVAMLIGLDWLEDGGFEIFETDVLGELGLAGYLANGGGVAPADLAANRDRLNAYDGPVLILYSRAFGGAPTLLKPGPGVAHLGTWHEDIAPVSFEKLPSTAAFGTADPSATGTPSDTPPKSPFLTVLLAILALPIAAAFLFILIYGMLN
ncbi:hypothetical protein [Shimia abyssi]|uniref:Uncharacterized protein n=1 Tax=Shimia abyssi TaxID=1662395 RepID=A0A2P8FH04_9RHOB|nr:hypothetical protein [Shimia abyssi]PSL20987.1 hypothetical protein CLV88_102106 [Shimia abyssi]